ncbi:unnamed protein product [Moneuplotes crassus]|uniref:Uncharacterized protein n=1 Tax=Euplotes crassus TaxID=5936 RepID=A0AAD1XKE4_EUPCR|nr:unnamed protein product [Moneuplotes crassus]
MSLSKTKQTWTKCMQATEKGTFLDGLVLATLIQDQSHSIEDWASLFQDWKESASEMGLNEDKQKLLMYSSFLLTYNLGKHRENMKKRDYKKLDKNMEGADSSTSASYSLVHGSKSDYKDKDSCRKEKESSKDFKEEEKDIINMKNSKKSDTPQAKEKASSQETEEEIAHKCTICHKISRKARPLKDCSHYIHNSCMKMKAITTMITGKYKIICHDKECTELIHRDDIFSVIDEKAQICYDSLQFLLDYSNIETERIIYWCFTCRLLNCKFGDENSKCVSCNKKQDKLKSVFTLIKLVIAEREAKYLFSQNKSKDSKNHEAINKCIDDCKDQLERCPDCLMWKHQFTGLALKCLC